MTNASSAESRLKHRPGLLPRYRWWKRTIALAIDHEAVVTRIKDESGWTSRYAFMTMMSAGIAILGLLLSSPAVVIGAMLISPLMSAILGFGFSLALFDFAELRRSLTALLGGAVVAVAFTALIVVVSPLKAPTAEILARTRPNLFDLLVALFAALAGTFAIIRGRGETIVGVAIATALMPPLAVVGFGLATWNMPVLGGSLALFVTNLMTIALAATLVARFYGFGHYLSNQQTWAQSIILLLVFAGMSVPLGFSLTRIAGESVTAAKIRSYFTERFGSSSRVTQLDIDFDRKPISVRAVVIAPRSKGTDNATLNRGLSAALEQPVKLQVDQVLMRPGAGQVEVQRAEMQQASSPMVAEDAEVLAITKMAALGAGISPDDVIVDRDHHRVVAVAKPLPGATAATYRALEQRMTASNAGWQVAIIPPVAALPTIEFKGGDDTLDSSGRDAVLLSAWEAQRWNVVALGVPGLPAGDASKKPNLVQRRALAIATLLATQGVKVTPAPPAAAGTAVILTSTLDQAS
jgi:uncharacterized hydrophobic protein (TIGR00271 family)